MAKFEEVTTFNIDEKTFTVESLTQEGKDLLRVYLETEEDIVKNKIALVKSQHALNSMGIMFRELLKTVTPYQPPAANEEIEKALDHAVEAIEKKSKTKK